MSDSPPIPVVCDQCRQTGILGEGPFAALRDILDFKPVERRAHAHGWKPEHQRAFIAALAITGSANHAARAVGRYASGAEQLRKAPGGRSFAEAWDNALELARERELARIQASVARLAADSEQRDALAPPPPGGAWSEEARPLPEGCDYDPEVHADDYPQYWESLQEIRARLLRARRLLLMLIAGDPARRAAWEVLVGPVDWQRAERLEPQDDEPIPDPERNPRGLPNMRSPDMVLAVEAGLLPDLAGGHDALAEIRRAVAAARDAHPEDFD